MSCDHLIVPSLGKPRSFAKTCAKGSRIFVGFDDAALDGLLSGFDQRVQGASRVASVHGVQLIPLTRLAKGLFAGGIIRAGDYLTQLSLHRGYGSNRVAHVMRPEVVPPVAKTADRLSRACFGGYLFDHYGHFLLEGLARVLSTEISASTDPIVFFNPQRMTHLPSYMSTVFSRIGVDPARIQLCDKPVLVDELRVQEPSFEIRGFVRPGVYDRLKADVAAAQASQIVYLTRSKLIGRRVIEGESIFAEWLARHMAADVIAPETLSLEAQLSKYCGAGYILGCEGSAFHTLMFLRRTSNAVIFCSSLPNMNYLLCDELFDGNTIYVRAVQAERDADGRARWKLDTEVAVKVVSSVLDAPPGDAAGSAGVGSSS